MSLTERTPYTQSRHHFRHYRDEFIQLYQSIHRASLSPSPIILLLDQAVEAAISEYEQPIALALSAISALGFKNVTTPDLLRLLSNDETTVALKIMADVRAYFQGTR